MRWVYLLTMAAVLGGAVYAANKFDPILGKLRQDDVPGSAAVTNIVAGGGITVGTTGQVATISTEAPLSQFTNQINVSGGRLTLEGGAQSGSNTIGLTDAAITNAVLTEIPNLDQDSTDDVLTNDAVFLAAITNIAAGGNVSVGQTGRVVTVGATDTDTQFTNTINVSGGFLTLEGGSTSGSNTLGLTSAAVTNAVITEIPNIDQDGTDELLLDGSRAMTGDLNMGGNSITNVGTNTIEFTDGSILQITGGDIKINSSNVATETFVTDTAIVSVVAGGNTSVGVTGGVATVGSFMSLTGLWEAVNFDDWAGVGSSGSTASNLVDIDPYTQINGTNDFGFEAFFASAPEVQDTFAWKKVQVPPWAAGFGDPAVTIKAIADATGILTNKAHVRLMDGVNQIETNNIVPTTADEIIEVTIAKADLPSAWTNNFETVRSNLVIRANVFVSHSNHYALGVFFNLEPL